MATARRYFGNALEADPNSVPTYVAWALVEERHGDFERACEILELAVRGRADDIELWNTYLALVERQGTLLQVSRVKERASQALALTQSKQRAGYRLSRAPDFQQALAELGAKLGERLVAPPELAGEMLDANLAYLAVPAGSRRR